MIILYSDDSFIFSSKTSYQYSGLGVSDLSSFDRTLFKVNPDMKIEWITSYDFHNNSDQEESIMDYNDLVYIGWTSGIQDHYYWIVSSLATSGELYQNKWYFKNSSSLVNGRTLTFILISEYHIFAYETITLDKDYRNMFIYEHKSIFSIIFYKMMT